MTSRRACWVASGLGSSSPERAGEAGGEAAAGGDEVGAGLGTPEVGAEGGQREGRCAGAEALHDAEQAVPEIGVGGAGAAIGAVSEVGGGVPAEVALAGQLGGGGVEEGAALLGDEEEDQAVGQAEELPVVGLGVEGAALQALVEGDVVAVMEEAGAEGGDGRLDALAQALEDPDAQVAALGEPGLEVAVRGLRVLDAALVADQPEEAELGVLLAVHDRLEVELDAGLAGQAVVVADEAQGRTVGDEAPEVVVGAVEEVLDQAVGRDSRGAGDARGAAAEVDAPADQVDRGALVEVGDREGPAVDLEAGPPGEASVAERVEERQEPALAGEAGGRGALGQPGDLLLAGAPGEGHAVLEGV